MRLKGLAELQKEYKSLEAMYADKLDGKIGERFYEQKSAAWREDQKDILRRLEEHQDASLSYMDEGIALMELAHRTASSHPNSANPLACLQIWRRPAHKKRLLGNLPAAVTKKSSLRVTLYELMWRERLVLSGPDRRKWMWWRCSWRRADSWRF